MDLKIQPTRRIGTKITTLIAVFALVFQPVSGFVASQVANAISSPELNSIAFSTMSIAKGSTYNGIVVDYRPSGFTDATSLKVTIHRENAPDVSRAGTLAAANILNNGGKSLTVPFNFAGSTSSTYWGPLDSTWTKETRPTGVTVEVATASHGLVAHKTPEGQNLVERNGTYESIVPVYPTFTLRTGGKEISNGDFVNPNRAALGDSAFRFEKSVATDSLVVNGTTVNNPSRTGNFGYAIPKDGIYEMYTQSTAGYRSNVLTFTVDSTAPTIDAISTNGFDFATDGTAVVSGVDGITFQFTISDEFAGHDYTYAEVKKASGEWVQGTSGLHLRGATPTWQIPANKTQADGKYVLKLSTRDKLGNSKSVEYKFSIDNTIPTFSLMDGQNPRKPINDGAYVNLDRLSNSATQSEQVYFSGKNSTDTLYLNESPIFNHGYFEGSNSGKIGAAFKTDGKYTLYTKNVLGTQSAKIAFTVDETTPIINVPQSNSGPVSGEKTFEISQTEVNPDRTYVEYMEKNQNGDWKKKTGQWFHEANVFSYTVDTTNWDDGLHQIKISTWDRADNHTSTTFTVNVDKTAPEAASDLQVNGKSNQPYYANATTSLKRTWTAGKSDDVSHYIYRSFTTKAAADNKTGGFSKNVGLNTEVNGKTGHSFWWSVVTVDNAGNESWSDTFQVIYDNTAPSFSIESPANGQHVSGTIVLNAKITDDSDITKVLMNIGGISRSWTNGSSSTITRTDDVFSTTVDTSMLPEGPVYVTLRGTDGAGNTRYWNNNTKSRQHVFYVDRTAPTAQVTGVTPIYNDNIGGSNVKVSFRVNDASEINLDRTYVMFADGPGTTKQHKESSKIYLKNLEQSADGVYVATFDTKKFVAENYTGRYNLQFTLVDVHGNNTSTKPIEYRNILIDNSGPGSALSTPASGSYVQGKEAKLTFTLSDDTGVSSVRVRLTNTVTGFEKWYNVNVTDFSDTEGSLTFDTTELPEGEYTITIRPVDSFGQPRSGPNKGTVIVDRTAPVIAITSATPSLITGTVGADAEKVLVRVGDQPEREATIGEDGTTWTLTISPALTAGADVIARAVDAANNTNSASTNPKWATGTIYVRTPVTNGPLESRNDAPSQGGSSAILANTAPTLQVTSPVADTTDETGDVAGAATVNKDSEDKGQVLAAEDVKDSWSLINLLLTIGIGVASIISLLGLLGSSRKDRKLASRLLTIVPAAGAVVALLLIEDFSGSMIWVNVWSLLIGALAVIQMIILGMSKITTNE